MGKNMFPLGVRRVTSSPLLPAVCLGLLLCCGTPVTGQGHGLTIHVYAWDYDATLGGDDEEPVLSEAAAWALRHEFPDARVVSHAPDWKPFRKDLVVMQVCWVNGSKGLEGLLTGATNAKVFWLTLRSGPFEVWKSKHGKVYYPFRVREVRDTMKELIQGQIPNPWGRGS